jgi:hypothetical protein
MNAISRLLVMPMANAFAAVAIGSGRRVGIVVI